MHYVLDLDLDFFVSPIAHDSWGPQPERLSGNEYRHSTSDEVRIFLEQKCHLSRDSKILGREVVEHVDAFSTWRRWLEEKKLSGPFTVFHIDAHADMGYASISLKYLLTELLALPVEQRRIPRIGGDALNSGSYIAFAVANHWISDLRYVFPNPAHCAGTKATNTDIVVMINGEPIPELPVVKAQRNALAKRSAAEAKLPYRITEQGDDPIDLVRPLFREGHWKTGFLELKQYRPEDIWTAVKGGYSSPVSVEPAIPFDLISEREFEFSGFTHMILAQSPQFTPASADQLLPVIREYFKAD